MTDPYYQDDQVTLYHGDSRELTEWLTADVLVFDPPYGRNWKQGGYLPSKDRNAKSAAHAGIAGDQDTTVRDTLLAMWGGRHAVVFGDLMLAPPAGTKLTAIYRKPPNSGARGAVGGYRRDVEAIYLLGPWPSGLGGRSSIIATSARSQGNPHSPQGRYEHPHAKPVDVMERLIAACPPGAIADPTCGTGSTLIAARNAGRRVIGVELEERYCEIAARRLSQTALTLEPDGDVA